MANPGWIEQQLNRMAIGIGDGKTRKRAVHTVTDQGSNEAELKAAVKARGWRLARVGDDYVIAPPEYVIKPLV